MMFLRRRFIVGAVAVFTLAGMVGCSSSIVVPEGPQSAGASKVPNLDGTRINRILDETKKHLDVVNLKQTPGELDGRLSPLALRIRQDQLRTAEAEKKSLQPVSFDPSKTVVTNSQGWPRSMVSIGSSSEATLPILTVFRQKNPHANYELQQWTRLLGGVSIDFSGAEKSTDSIDGDSAGFVMKPREALEAYVAMINSGTAGSDKFAVDEWASSFFASMRQIGKSIEKAGTVTTSAKTGDFPITGLTTRDGSALVSATFTIERTYQRTVAGSKLKVGGAVNALPGGDDNVIGSRTVKYVVPILIRLPTKGSENKAQVVGVDQIIDAVTSDDSTRPRGEAH